MAGVWFQSHNNERHNMSGMRVPERQVRAFDKAVAERLGLDPTIIGDDFNAHWTTYGDEELGKVKVTFTAYLPADEILAMFNGTWKGTA